MNLRHSPIGRLRAQVRLHTPRPSRLGLSRGLTSLQAPCFYALLGGSPRMEGVPW
jgi:hypothetical protein